MVQPGSSSTFHCPLVPNLGLSSEERCPYFAAEWQRLSERGMHCPQLQRGHMGHSVLISAWTELGGSLFQQDSHTLSRTLLLRLCLQQSPPGPPGH
jgi:hypothetical protein